MKLIFVELYICVFIYFDIVVVSIEYIYIYVVVVYFDSKFK